MMLEYLKKELNWTRTENGAVTHKSTQSACLDLFATIGALRGADEEEIWQRFLNAYCENPLLAMRLLFYARDVRGGLGERRVFRVIWGRLAAYAPESVKKNIRWVGYFGRYDDLLALLDTSLKGEAVEEIREQLWKDMRACEAGKMGISLLAKWMPSVNASCPETVARARQLAKALGMREKEYRTTLSTLRKRIDILENYLRERDYTFSYEKVPSRAGFRYRKAFMRNDELRYREYIERVQAGEAKMNTAALYPYDIIAPVLLSATSGRKASLTREERMAVDAAWNSQADFTKRENALAVIDGSGSMYWNGVRPIPAAVALSLGIYFAERNDGPFRNHFITFSEHPQLVEIRGKDICAKVEYCMRYNEVANTNLERVFRLILDTAVKYRMTQEQLPARIYIISDMEFDVCVRNGSKTNYDNAARMFAAQGYRLPQIVFWNVASRNRQQPVTKDQQGTVLVSGCTPRLFEMAASGQMSPYRYMLDILNGERYAVIEA